MAQDQQVVVMRLLVFCLLLIPLIWVSRINTKNLYMIDAVIIGLYAVPKFRKLILEHDLASIPDPTHLQNIAMMQKVFRLFSSDPKAFLKVPPVTVNHHIRRHFAPLLTDEKEESMRHVYKKLLGSLGPTVWKRFGIGNDGRAQVFMATLPLLERQLKDRSKNPAILAVQGEIGLLPDGNLSMPLAFNLASKKNQSSHKDSYLLSAVIWETTRSVRLLTSHRLESKAGVTWYLLHLRKRTGMMTLLKKIEHAGNDQRDLIAHLAKNKSRFFIYARQKRHLPPSLYQRISGGLASLSSTLHWCMHENTGAAILRTALPILLKSGIFAMKISMFVQTISLIVDSFFTQNISGGVGLNVGALKVLGQAANVTDLSTHSFIDLLLDYYAANSEANDRAFAAVANLAAGAATGVAQASSTSLLGFLPFGGYAAGVFNASAELALTGFKMSTNTAASYRIILRMLTVMLLKFIIRMVGRTTMVSLQALKSRGKTGKAVRLLEKKFGVYSADADISIPKDIAIAGTEEAKKMIRLLNKNI